MVTPTTQERYVRPILLAEKLYGALPRIRAKEPPTTLYQARIPPTSRPPNDIPGNIKSNRIGKKKSLNVLGCRGSRKPQNFSFARYVFVLSCSSNAEGSEGEIDCDVDLSSRSTDFSLTFLSDVAGGLLSRSLVVLLMFAGSMPIVSRTLPVL